MLNTRTDNLLDPCNKTAIDMKILFFLLTAAAVLPSTLGIFLSYVPWSVPNNDVKSHVVFPMNIANAPKKRGYYFMQYFTFTGQVNGSYIGLQPQDDGSIRAAFSTFMDKSTTSDANCHLGADYGPGVTCGVIFKGSYANTYDLDVRNTGGTTWTGTVIDTVTRVSTHIGTWTLPSGGGTTLAWHIGAVEYFKSPIPACDKMPYTSVVFGVPRTDAGVGSVKDPYEVGACKGKDNFKFTRTADLGVEISVGFTAKETNFHSQPEEDYGNGNCT